MQERNRFVVLAALLVFTGISAASHAQATEEEDAVNASDEGKEEIAIFAGGCFWCMEPPFDELKGVASTTSGFAGGEKADPTYEEVSAGGTGHLEAVRIEFDGAKITYEQLLDVFWRNIDPLDDGGQFCDRGASYRTAIFYANAEQKRLAEQSQAALEASGRFDEPIVTQILPASEFWPAEDYHQNYYEENPLRYKYYRWRCGRDERLEELWGDS